MNSKDMFAGGPLAFPVTPFNANGELDTATFEKHVSWLVGFGTPAVFVGCGTGEVSSLDAEECAELVHVAKQIVPSTTAVIAGVGQGFRVAQSTLKAVEAAGCDATLVLPPYLLNASQEGLFRYYSQLADTATRPVILYQRDNAIFEPETVVRLAQHPSITGLKDGSGDVELVQRIVATIGDGLQYFNGMPTAETFQLAYGGMGVHNYSSAVFNFVPEVSWAFYTGLKDGNSSIIQALLKEFFVPLAKLRNKGKGYAVALVKAGVGIRWGSVGSVRPPLVDAAQEHVRELEGLIERGLEIVGVDRPKAGT